MKHPKNQKLLHLLDICSIHRYNNLLFYFSGLYTNELYHAEEVIPRKVSHNAEFISHDLKSFHQDNTTHFNITFNNEDHFLILNNARSFIAPGAIIQRHRRDIHTRYKPKFESTNCHFQGIVHGKPNSIVAISACNGLVSKTYLHI